MRRQDLQRSWDPAWEKTSATQDWGKYPPEELIRFVARNYYRSPDRGQVRFLDLGCGSGAAAWYIALEGFRAHGIDGSPTAIKVARARFRREGLRGTFRVGDFIRLDYPDESFDCVVEIGALQHNRPALASRILREVHRVLKPGGRIFSMILDRKSRFRKGFDLLENKGYIHLYNRRQIERLFARFKPLLVESSARTDRGNLVAHHVVSGRK